MTHSLTHLMNYEAVYRTAPATPGLLNMMTTPNLYSRAIVNKTIYCNYIFIQFYFTVKVFL